MFGGKKHLVLLGGEAPVVLGGQHLQSRNIVVAQVHLQTKAQYVAYV